MLRPEDRMYNENYDEEKITLSKVLQKREQASETVGRETNQDFKKFKLSFLDQIDHLREHLQSVYVSDTMGVEELYNLTGTMLSSMKYKAEAVLYLNAIYTSEYYIVEHCMRVGLLANILATWLGYDFTSIRDATVAGYLHDIGMLEVPKSIIEKQGALEPDELKRLQDHGVRGSLMLMNKGVTPKITEAVRFHHERYDGSGYPKGKKGDQISPLTSLISIADVYDSMTSNRPYRVATCPFDVIEFLEKQMIDKLNPELLYVFLENIPYIYNGALVKLSDGSTARVVFINKAHKTSPIVQLEETGECIDLFANRRLKIESLM